MSNITVRKDVRRQEGNILSYPVAASTKLFEGALIALNASGYAVKAADTTNFTFVGVCDETADNTSGSAGDIRVKVWTYGVVDVVANFSAAAADAGKKVYQLDDQTVDLAANVTNDVLVGKIVEVVSASKLRVAITPFA